MKKKLLIFLLILIIGTAGIIGLAAYNFGTLLNTVKPYLAAELSSLLHTPITIGEITPHISLTPSASISELSIGEGSSKFTLQGISIKVDLQKILEKKLVITELLITTPQIALLKTAEGLQIPGMGKNNASQPAEPEKGTSSPNTSKQNAGEKQSGIASSPIPISLEKVSVSDASLTIEDQATGTKMGVTKFNLSTGVNVEGTLLKLSNLSLSGENIAPPMPLSFQTHELTFDTARGILELPDAGLTALGTVIGLSNTLAISHPGNNPLETDLNLTKNIISIFGGMVSAPASLKLPANTFEVAPVITKIQIDQATGILTPGIPSKLFGIVSKVTGNLRGALGGNLMHSLDGSFDVLVEKGGIRGVNLGGLILKEVKDIPLLSGALFSKIPSGYRPLLESPDTTFDSLVTSIAFRSGTINLKSLVLKAPLYSIDSSGTMGLDGSVDLDATISFTQEFSAGLAASSPGFERLLSTDGRLIFPLVIKGKVPAIIVLPNLSKLLQSAAGEVIKEKVSNAIEKALGGKGGDKQAGKNLAKGLGTILGF